MAHSTTVSSCLVDFSLSQPLVQLMLILVLPLLYIEAFVFNFIVLLECDTVNISHEFSGFYLFGKLNSKRLNRYAYRERQLNGYPPV